MSILYFLTVLNIAHAEERNSESTSDGINEAENENKIVSEASDSIENNENISYVIDYKNPFQYEQWQSPTGKKVFLVEDHRVPIVELRIAIPTGLWHQIDAELHLEESLSVLTYDPDGKLRATSTMLAFDFYTEVNDEFSLIRANYLSEDVEKVQEHLLKILSNVSFDEQELKRLQKSEDIAWKSNLKEPSFIGKREVLKTLFPDENDARQINYLQSDDIETNTEALRQHQQKIFSVKNIQFGFAGDIDKAGAQDWISKLETIFSATEESGLEIQEIYFGNTRNLEEKPVDIDVPQPNLNQVYFFFFRDLIPVHSEKYPIYLVADQVLAGSFYSRLYQALRHEDGDTYGVSSREFWAIDNDGLLSIETFTRADNAPELEEKLRRTISTFQKEGITQEEFEQAVGNIVGRDKRRIQAPTQILGRQLVNSVYGRHLDYNQDLVNKVQQLTLEEVNTFIEEFYIASKFGMIRVVPEE